MLIFLVSIDQKIFSSKIFMQFIYSYPADSNSNDFLRECIENTPNIFFN